jgi:hypothetical protein
LGGTTLGDLTGINIENGKNALIINKGSGEGSVDIRSTGLRETGETEIGDASYFTFTNDAGDVVHIQKEIPIIRESGSESGNEGGSEGGNEDSGNNTGQPFTERLFWLKPQAGQTVDIDLPDGISADSSLVHEGNAIDFTVVGDKLRLTLTDSQLDLSEGPMIFDYMTYQDSEGTGRTVQIVLTNEIPKSTEAITDPENEGFQAERDIVIMLDATGDKWVNQTLDTGDGADTITLAGTDRYTLKDSEIYGGDDADTITISAVAEGYAYALYESEIDGGDGADTITVSAEAEGADSWAIALEYGAIHGGDGDGDDNNTVTHEAAGN